MKKCTSPFTAQLVTHDTPLPFKEVIARLDTEVNKPGSSDFLAKFRTVRTKFEMEELILASLGAKDFLYVHRWMSYLLYRRHDSQSHSYFLEMNHDKWMNLYTDEIGPQAVVYTLGNPLLAATIMQRDIRAGYSLPPRLMIVQKPDGDGTNVMYHLPSSVVAWEDNPGLKAALEVLNDKLDQMVTRITTD